jgi:hypothetical protein
VAGLQCCERIGDAYLGTRLGNLLSLGPSAGLPALFYLTCRAKRLASVANRDTNDSSILVPHGRLAWPWTATNRGNRKMTKLMEWWRNRPRLFNRSRAEYVEGTGWPIINDLNDALVVAGQCRVGAEDVEWLDGETAKRGQRAC